MIFYFSCTGNTRWAAREVAEATGDALCDISTIGAGVYEYRVLEGERIGLCFPVHAWRPPVVVREFIRRLRIVGAGDPFCWVLLTAGDDIGETVDLLESDLRPTGLHLHSAYSLLMPESYVGLPFMDVDKAERERQKKLQAKADLQSYIQGIVYRREGERHLHLSRWPRTNSRFLGGIFVKWLLSDRPFRVDAHRCIGCGKCVKSCPVDNIALTDHGTPEWLHSGRCLTCFACYHHCAARAIEYGRRTHGKGHYYFEKDQH